MQIEGNNAKADDAIMLDQDGYLSETNATNIVCPQICPNCKEGLYCFADYLLGLSR